MNSLEMFLGTLSEICLRHWEMGTMMKNSKQRLTKTEENQIFYIKHH